MPPPSAATASACSIDRLLVEGVDLGGLRRSAGRADGLGDLLELARVRPARNTLAPSRAKARETAPPIEPPAP